MDSMEMCYREEQSPPMYGSPSSYDFNEKGFVEGADSPFYGTPSQLPAFDFDIGLEPAGPNLYPGSSESHSSSFACTGLIGAGDLASTFQPDAPIDIGQYLEGPESPPALELQPQKLLPSVDPILVSIAGQKESAASADLAAVSAASHEKDPIQDGLDLPLWSDPLDSALSAEQLFPSVVDPVPLAETLGIFDTAMLEPLPQINVGEEAVSAIPASSVSIPYGPEGSDEFCFDVSAEVHAGLPPMPVSEFIMSHSSPVEQGSPGSDCVGGPPLECAPIGGSPFGGPHSAPSLSPPIAGADEVEVKKTKGRKRPYSKRVPTNTLEDKRKRKMDQNRSSAQRYRAKKREEKEELENSIAEERAKQHQLRSSIKAIELKLDFYRAALLE